MNQCAVGSEQLAVARDAPDREEPLRPCPFCGGKGEINYVLADCWVTCQGCDANAAMHNTEAEAAAAWNRRVAGEQLAVGSGQLAVAQPNDEDGDELVRIRHTRSGRYLNVAMENRMIQRIMQPETALKFCWTDRIDSASDGTRLMARKIASAYIALTGDHDVELELVAEGGAE